ncbi:MAG: hypothetical protein R3C58_14675 [Parvularculaceae bacterium]
MNAALRRPALVNRALTSLAAILAVSVIFGAKALEVEKRAHAAKAETARLVSVRS